MRNGLSDKEVEQSRKQHGSNSLTQIPPDPLWKKVLEGFKDFSKPRPFRVGVIDW